MTPTETFEAVGEETSEVASQAVVAAPAGDAMEYTAETVKQIRGDMGQVEFAKVLKVSQGTISLVESGRQKVSKKLRKKLEEFQASA